MIPCESLWAYPTFTLEKMFLRWHQRTDQVWRKKKWLFWNGMARCQLELKFSRHDIGVHNDWISLESKTWKIDEDIIQCIFMIIMIIYVFVFIFIYIDIYIYIFIYIYIYLFIYMHSYKNIYSSEHICQVQCHWTGPSDADTTRTSTCRRSHRFRTIWFGEGWLCW